MFKLNKNIIKRIKKKLIEYHNGACLIFVMLMGLGYFLLGLTGESVGKLSKWLTLISGWCILNVIFQLQKLEKKVERQREIIGEIGYEKYLMYPEGKEEEAEIEEVRQEFIQKHKVK